MMKRALITGIDGFVARHLVDRLRVEGFEVVGIGRAPTAHVPAAKGVVRVTGDVCDATFVARTLREFFPSHVFHLAWEFGSPVDADRNVLAATTLFDAVAKAKPDAWTLLASSSAVYGSPKIQPIDESAPLAPLTPYGASKVAIEQVAAQFRRTSNVRVVVTRTFNLIGPGVPQRLFPGSLAAQVVSAERGGPRTIKVGRLDSSRDYVDVRDAVRAYTDLASREVGEPAEFNVCGSVARSSAALAQEFLAQAEVPVELVHDTARLQSGDVDSQCGSAARLRALTGWSPTISFAQSVRSMLEHARAGATVANGRASRS